MSHPPSSAPRPPSGATGRPTGERKRSRRGNLPLVLVGALVLVVLVGVAVWSVLGGATGAATSGDCVSGDADPRWELTLGEVDLYGEEGLIDAVRLADDTMVLRVAATGVDGSDVQGESVGRLLGVQDGEEVWSLDDVSLVTATADGEGVLATGPDDDLLRLDATGEEVWSRDGAVARHEHDGRLVVETEDETQTAVLDVATGEVEAEFSGQYADASAARVLLGASGDGISLVGLDGSEEWTVRPGDLDVGDGIAGVLNGDVAVVGETAALPTVVGLDAASGEEAWRLTEGLDDGSLSFTGPGPGGTVALDQAGEDGFETLLFDLSGEIARGRFLARTVYVDGEPMLLGREDDEDGARLFGAELEEVASYDGSPVAPCADALYIVDGPDLVAADWRSGDEVGRVAGVVGEDEGFVPLAVVDGGLIVESESEAGAVLTFYE